MLKRLVCSVFLLVLIGVSALFYAKQVPLSMRTPPVVVEATKVMLAP